MAQTSGNKRATEDSRTAPGAGAVGGSALHTATAAPAVESPAAKPKAPDAEWLIAEAGKLTTYWTGRNERMERHQRLFDLTEKTPAAGKMLVYLNDPKVIVEKIAALVDRREHRIEVPPQGEENVEAAQKIENALRHWSRLINERWAEGLHNPLPYDQSQSIFLRGWVAERITLDPDSENVVYDCLVDPYSVYPRMAGDRIKHIVRVYDATVADVHEDFPDAGEAFTAMEPEKVLHCIAFYDNRPPYYHGVLADGEWAKKPTGLGYWSWVVSTAKGRFSHHAVGMAEDDDPGTHIGEGFLDAIESIVANLQKFLTIMANVGAKIENPPKLIQTVDGRPKEIDLDTGASNYLMLQENVQVIDLGQHAAQLIPLISTFQDRINKGSLPSAMFGEGTSLESGFMSALMMGAAQDSLWTFIKALEAFHAQRYRKILELFRDHSDKDMPYIAKAQATPPAPQLYGPTGDKLAQRPRLEAGRPTWGQKLTVADVKANGIYVEVSYEDISPQDRVALGNLAALLVNAKLISLDTARNKYLGLDDPGLENQKVLGELVNTHPDAVKKLAEWSLEDTYKERELQALRAGEDEQAAAEKAKMAAALPEQGRPQGLPPGIPGPGEAGMPLGMPPGLPPNVLPGPMAGIPGSIPSDEELLAMIATGGA